MQRSWLVIVLASSVAISSAGAIAQVSPTVPPSPVPPVAAPPATNVPAPAVAENSNNVADPMATKDPDQIICLKEKLTGSMLPSTVCQTRRNWIRQGVDSRDLIGHAQNVGSGQPGGN